MLFRSRAQETYSEDTHHMGSMAVGFIEGVQSRGVIASAKHLAVNSIEDTRHRVDVRVDERTLREVYLPHFRRAVVDARVGSVMSAYNQVNGAWCDQSAHLLRDILRGEWGFAGFVESDWILGTHGDVESVRAGLDIEMPAAVHFDRLADALEAGRITEREVDATVRRILRAQLCYGLDARARVADDPTQRLTPAHLALAREVARRGIVLLRNEPSRGAPALPLDAAALRRLVVLGRNADVANLGDRGSSNVIAGDVVTALEGLRARAGAGVAVTHLAGAILDAAGQQAVREADAVVIVTGLQADDEGEATVGAGDRDGLALPPAEAWLVTSAMSSVIDHGTARGARALGRPAAGKTGTTDRSRDAWFVGYTPDLVAGVWVGFDDRQPLGYGEEGARSAVPIWTNFMRAYVAARRPPAIEFARPDGVIAVRVDPATGLLPAAAVDPALPPPATIEEYFLAGTEPRDFAPVDAAVAAPVDDAAWAPTEVIDAGTAPAVENPVAAAPVAVEEPAVTPAPVDAAAPVD